jgi:hypothetical protein
MARKNTARDFWARVDKRGPRQSHMRTRCWVWTANKDPDGYGRITWGNKTKRATHVSWFLAHGCWPTPMALHRCDVCGCVRPSHLFEGGALENNRDTHAKGRGADVSGNRNPSRRYPERVPRGEHHVFAKFTAATVRKVRALHATGKFTQVELAKRFKISRPHLCGLLKRKFWRHLP